MSQRHPTARRKQRDHDETDDLFVAKVLEISQWSSRHRQVLTGLGIVLVVLIGGGIYWRSYKASLAEQATQELVTIQQTRALGDPQQAEADLQVYLQRFGGTPMADEARLLLGQLELETGNPQGAITALEPLSGSRSPLGIQATYLLASAQEEAGNPEQAERLYLTVANRASLDFYVRDALAQAARIREDRGDYAGAAQLYEEVLTYIDENDPQRGVYELRLAEARTAQQNG